jgi:WD40 repeat protein
LFSRDGKLVLTVLDDNTARLWKTDGTELEVLSGHKNRISAAAFSPDGRMVATGSLDGTARLWSIKDGSVVRFLLGHGEALTDIAFSNDGQSIVTASRDHTARIWNVVDGTEVRVLKGHDGSLSQAEFSPNSRYVVTSSSEDGSVRLWATESGQEIAVLAERDEAGKGEPAITRASFSADGTEIAIVFGDKSARVVRVFPTPQELIDYARRMVPSD